MCVCVCVSAQICLHGIHFKMLQYQKNLTVCRVAKVVLIMKVLIFTVLLDGDSGIPHLDMISAIFWNIHYEKIDTMKNRHRKGILRLVTDNWSY